VNSRFVWVTVLGVGALMTASCGGTTQVAGTIATVTVTAPSPTEPPPTTLPSQTTAAGTTTVQATTTPAKTGATGPAGSTAPLGHKKTKPKAQPTPKKPTPKKTPTTTAPPPPEPLEGLVKRVRSGVIKITAATCDGTAIGTGFLLDAHHVATVQHVVNGAFSIGLVRNGKVVSSASVIGEDAARDLALLRSTETLTGYKLKLAGRAPSLGEEVVALGFPLDLPLTVTRGVVSGMNRTIPIEGVNRRRLVQTDAALNPGNSGGPLISINTGEVVGLVDARSTTASGIGFAVSGLVANPLLKAWTIAPQPSAAAGCAPPPAPPPVAAPPPPPPPSAPAVFEGRTFSIAYPTGWYIDTAEASKGSYYDTTIRSPEDSSTFLRVDMSPHAAPGLEANAAPVVAALRRSPGYHEIAYDFTQLAGFDALYWEFQNTERGVQMHKIDVFLIDNAGRGFAILTQAPQAQFEGWADEFAAIRESFISYSGE
jgi:serine protease Do